MNIPFDIVASKGPVIHKPIRTAEDVAEVRPLDPDQALPYVGETLRILRNEVSDTPIVAGMISTGSHAKYGNDGS